MKKLCDIILCILNSFLSFNSTPYAWVFLPMPKNVITPGLPFFWASKDFLLSELLALINTSCRILCKKVDILEDSDREMIIL